MAARLVMAVVLLEVGMVHLTVRSAQAQAHGQGQGHHDGAGRAPPGDAREQCGDRPAGIGVAPVTQKQLNGVEVPAGRGGSLLAALLNLPDEEFPAWWRGVFRNRWWHHPAGLDLQSEDPLVRGGCVVVFFGARCAWPAWPLSHSGTLRAAPALLPFVTLCFSCCRTSMCAGPIEHPSPATGTPHQRPWRSVPLLSSSRWSQHTAV